MVPVAGKAVWVPTGDRRASDTGRAAGGGLTAMPPSSGLQTAVVVLALPSLAWLLALLSVNSDALLFHYLFAISNCLQVIGVPR